MGAKCSSIERDESGGGCRSCIKAEAAATGFASAADTKTKRFAKPKKATSQQDESLPNPFHRNQDSEGKKAGFVRSKSTLGAGIQRQRSTISPAAAANPQQGPSKKVDLIRLERNMERFRKVALETAGELNHFGVFLKSSFGNPADAYAVISGNQEVQTIELESFRDGLRRLHFTGCVEKVFYGLCDDEAWSATQIITREGFIKRLSSMGNPFIVVVGQAFARNRSKIKRKVAEAMKVKNRDQELVEEFRRFIEPRFPTPGKCFDAIAGNDGSIDEEEFVEWLTQVDFPGDAAKVFHHLCDSDGYITRVEFSEILLRKGEQREGVAGYTSENPQEAEAAAPPAAAPKKTIDHGFEKQTSQHAGNEEPTSPLSPENAGGGKTKTSARRASKCDKKPPQDAESEEPAAAFPSRSERRKLSLRRSNSMLTDDENAEASSKKKGFSRRRSNSMASLADGEGEETVTKRKTGKRNSTSSLPDKLPDKLASEPKSFLKRLDSMEDKVQRGGKPEKADRKGKRKNSL